MTSEQDTLLAILRQHRDPAGMVNTNEQQIREWIGSDAADWPIHEMVLVLRDDGYLKVMLAECGGGEDGATLVVRV